MRRARIKAVATVPIRRKATQDGTSETVEPTEPKTSEINLKVEQQILTEPDPIVLKTQEAEKIDAQVIPVKIDEIVTETIIENSSTVSNSEQKGLESIINIENESQPKNEIRPVSQINSPQNLMIPTIEGSNIKTIQNRSCFMRPTPRLDGGGRVRRNSIQGSGASASESEDDSRRSISIAPSRVRNDSVCSVQSLKDGGNINNITKLNLGQKRRMVVSESARKLAESRREFLLKHEKTTPDKSKLTMYDLIYYNPVTNPMKPKPVGTSKRKISVCSTSVKNDKEDVDEPSEMLVPQVKVGPNGELIIDEQSLVIDQYKAQDNIDRSDIIVDEDTTGNGFYKRRKKSKEWSKWETVKFYKALNTYGTDFLLMQNTFSTRTREELKLKYKKEEKLNHQLIEKALQYQEFDTEALAKNLAIFEENQRKETELNKPKNIKNSTNATEKKPRQRCRTTCNEIDCKNNDEYNIDEPSSEENGNTITKPNRAKQNRKRVIRKRKQKYVDKNKSNSDKDNKDNSDSEQETYKAKPTRSGRAPRKTKNSQKSVINCDDKANQNKEEQEIKKINGSIVINDECDKEAIKDSQMEIIQETDSQNIKKNDESNKVIESKI